MMDNFQIYVSVKILTWLSVSYLRSYLKNLNDYLYISCQYGIILYVYMGNSTQRKKSETSSKNRNDDPGHICQRCARTFPAFYFGYLVFQLWIKS